MHLGIAWLDDDDITRAKEAFRASLIARDNPDAQRGLALIAEWSHKIDDAAVLYTKAWQMAEGDVDLAAEITEFLYRHARHDAMRDFVAGLPDRARAHDRIRLAVARVALSRGDYVTVQAFLDAGMASIGEGETCLTDLWFEMQQAHGSGEVVPPRAIDFRMAVD